MSAKGAMNWLMLACCFVLAAVCLRIPASFGSRRTDAEAADRAALVILNAVRDAEKARTDCGRLLLEGQDGETEWYAENGVLKASGEDAAPVDAFAVGMDGEMLEVTVRKGGAERTLRFRAGAEAGA